MVDATSVQEDATSVHPFKYDRFQEEAIAAIREGTSVFVSAPTGAGKTVIAEVAVEEALAQGAMAIYTAPIKALSNQKFRDFYARYGERVGILTGDVTLNPEAPLLIMTTEIYRNSLLEQTDRFARCRWIVFDEVHYLDDPERGTVWEEALLLTPRQTEILALSATIPNAGQIAAWIQRIHGRPVKVAQETHRPVPLKVLFQCQDQLFRDLENLRTSGYAGFQHRGLPRRPPSFRIRRFRRGRPIFKTSLRAGGPFAPGPRGRPNRADHLLRQIQAAGHLPCLYFTFSRRRAEDLAWEFAALGLISPEDRKQLTEAFDRLCQQYQISHERSALSLRELVAQGAAYHHAGLLPMLKEVIEILFSTRRLATLVTTETFALGINMPARSVVLATLMKRSDGPRSLLKVRELSQMAGRAGRRGMDETGFVYLRLNPWEVPFSELARLLQGKPEQVSSRFNLTYATLLNLYRHHGSDLAGFYQRTLHAFQAPKIYQREALSLIQRKLALLKELRYLKELEPLEKPGHLEETRPSGKVGYPEEVGHPEGPGHPGKPGHPEGPGPSEETVASEGRRSSEGPGPSEGHRPGVSRPEPVGHRWGNLTPKGIFAASLYGYELILSELFGMGFLDRLDLTDLAILLLSLVYEPRRGGTPVPLPRRIHALESQVRGVLLAIHAQERRFRIAPLSKGPSFQLSWAMELWVGGASFEKTVEKGKADEGEIIRTFRMTIQLARALTTSRMASRTLKERALHLIQRINRDPVDAEAELRRSL